MLFGFLFSGGRRRKIALSWLAGSRRREVREEIIRDEIIIGKRIGGWNRWSGGWLVVGVIKEAVNCRGLYNNHYFRSIRSLRFTCQPATHSRADRIQLIFRVQRQNDDRAERRVIYAKQQRRQQRARPRGSRRQRIESEIHGNDNENQKVIKKSLHWTDQSRSALMCAVNSTSFTIRSRKDLDRKTSFSLCLRLVRSRTVCGGAQSEMGKFKCHLAAISQWMNARRWRSMRT